LDLILGLLASAAGTAYLGLAVYLLGKHGTSLLRDFLVFGAALLLLTLAFAEHSVAAALLRFFAAMPRQNEVASVLALANHIGVMLRGVGGILLVLVLPGLVNGFFGRAPVLVYTRASLASALLMILGFLAYFLGLEPGLVAVLVSLILFANIAFSIAVLGWRLFAVGPGPGARGAGKPALPAALFAPAPPARPAYIGLLRRFFFLSAFFLPPFVADAFLLGRAGLPAWTQALDNCSVPLYFLILDLGCISLAAKGLDHPPLMEEERITAYAKGLYGLTDREAEILEYVIDGYGAKDLAGVLGIAAKTAENHLYSIYQKTGVTNRIQLFQLFQSQRRGS
jgi:DNA-binding CsgD family transcriptional regulator